MENFLKILLGDMDAGAFFAYYLLALVGAFGRFAYRANKKRKTAFSTPSHFDFRIFFQDNVMKFIQAVLTIGLAIRFSNEVIGQELTGYGSVLIGVGLGQFSIFSQSVQNKAR